MCTLRRFQSTLLQEERHNGYQQGIEDILFQSTLLQEERRCSLDPGEGNMCISIHAPTRGATSTCEARYIISLYFNPRSYKRSDLSNVPSAYLLLNFNPRSYKRSDHIAERMQEEIIISIHAPTRGATVIRFREMYKVYDFNPRSYKRSDCICSASVQNVYYFNPRSYKRSDQMSNITEVWENISIHAPTRGATAKMHNIPYASLQ